VEEGSSSITTTGTIQKKTNNEWSSFPRMPTHRKFKREFSLLSGPSANQCHRLKNELVAFRFLFSVEFH